MPARGHHDRVATLTRAVVDDLVPGETLQHGRAYGTDASLLEGLLRAFELFQRAVAAVEVPILGEGFDALRITVREFVLAECLAAQRVERLDHLDHDHLRA